MQKFRKALLFSHFQNIFYFAAQLNYPFFLFFCLLDFWLCECYQPSRQRSTEPPGFPFLCPKPCGGPLGLHHLPQVHLPACTRTLKLPLQQARSEEHSTRWPLASLREHSAERRVHCSPEQNLLCQPSVSTSNKPHYLGQGHSGS